MKETKVGYVFYVIHQWMQFRKCRNAKCQREAGPHTHDFTAYGRWKWTGGHVQG